MSEENVELARQYFDALNKGGMDASERFRHPDIEVLEPPDFPDAGRYVGEASVRELIEGYLELGWDGQFHVQEDRSPLRGRKGAPSKAVLDQG